MLQPFSLFIGLRYTLSKKRSRSVSFISGIAMTGIVLGVALLITVLSVMNGFDKVDISGQYTGIKIGVEKEASFDFEIDLQYADFKRDDSKVELFKNISKTTKKYYEGTYGQKKTNSSLFINSQYDGVRIEEN